VQRPSSEGPYTLGDIAFSILSHVDVVMPTIFHDEAIEIAVEAQDASTTKFAQEGNDLVRDAYFVLSHDAIRVHRAIGCLVDNGWSGPGAALARTLIDLSVSAIAIAESRNRRMAAFKYLYGGFRRHARDQGLPSSDRRRMFDQIRKRLDQLPEALRPEAVAVVKERDRSYWFAPEWRSPSAVIEQHADAELNWSYLQMSAVAHGGFLGMRLFRDSPDAMNLNPDPIGPRAMSLDMMSSRWLVEIVRIRDAVERLGIVPRIDEFVERLSVAVAELPRAR